MIPCVTSFDEDYEGASSEDSNSISSSDVKSVTSESSLTIAASESSDSIKHNELSVNSEYEHIKDFKEFYGGTEIYADIVHLATGAKPKLIEV